jgi:hypothetical protein
MPTYDDYEGVYFTVQALRLYHAAAMKYCQIAVLDNNESEHTRLGFSLMSRITDGVIHATEPPGATRQELSVMRHRLFKYISRPDVQGTANAKQMVFEIADAEWVLLIDCHVMLAPNAIQELLNYIHANPDSNDLLQGPILWDHLQGGATHFDEAWSGAMEGRWADDPRGYKPGGEPFEIGAQGTGLMACRKEVWRKIGGFNPKMRGFFGEAWYIHRKIRANGGRVLCCPFLQWVHRFDRPAGIPYPLTNWHKARNYVIGHTETGDSLDPVYAEFVGTGKVPLHEWQQLVANPSDPPEWPDGYQQKPQRAAVVVTAAPPSKPEAFPCIHRGEVIEQRDCKPCDGGPRDVYRCTSQSVAGGECTINSSKLKNDGGKIPGCAVCELRAVPVALLTSS